MKLEQAVTIEQLRDRHYNAQVVSSTLVHEELQILRIAAFGSKPDYESGQYLALGLGTWEKTIYTQPPSTGNDNKLPQKLIKRAYSVSCPLLDDSQQLITTRDYDYLEFYIALVSNPADNPPSLTPRLFALQPGDRISMGTRGRGTYTLEDVAADDALLFISTGTGEAPHNAMIPDLLSRKHCGQICSVICTRYAKDLGYQIEHRKLEQMFPNYRYISLTTREPKNIDPGNPNYVGKQYIQDFFASGQLESVWGYDLNPARTHVYLCGNPAMIGPPVMTTGGVDQFPDETGMVELLVNRGFELDRPKQPGNIHFEKYW